MSRYGTGKTVQSSSPTERRSGFADKSGSILCGAAPSFTTGIEYFSQIVELLLELLNDMCLDDDLRRSMQAKASTLFTS